MFSLRKFISICITFSFLLMSYTGIMLFIVPQGKYAYWMHWEFWGLSKTQYGNLHVTFMVLFLSTAIIHIYLNWKPLLTYLKNKQRDFSLLTKEFLLAFFLTLVFIFGTIYEIPPFKNFLNFEEGIKQSWVQENYEPPYGHAELSSLQSLTKRTFIDLDKAIQTLKDKGFVGVEPKIQLEKLALLNKTTPAAIYALINTESNELSENKQEKDKVKKPQMGSGLGQMSIEQVTKRYSLNLEQALRNLEAKGINANKDDNLKAISQKLGITPFELFDILSE
jgi:hypothetical protein